MFLYEIAQNCKSTGRGDPDVQGFVSVGEWSDGGMECGRFDSFAKAVVKKTKTQLETVMTRHLAIVDPRNGPKFIKEVRIVCTGPQRCRVGYKN